MASSFRRRVSASWWPSWPTGGSPGWSQGQAPLLRSFSEPMLLLSRLLFRVERAVVLQLHPGGTHVGLQLPAQDYPAGVAFQQAHTQLGVLAAQRGGAVDAEERVPSPLRCHPPTRRHPSDAVHHRVHRVLVAGLHLPLAYTLSVIGPTVGSCWSALSPQAAASRSRKMGALRFMP